MTWIPLPSIPLARGRLRLSEVYQACPETGEIRNPLKRILCARRAGTGSTAVHVWGRSPSAARRAATSTTVARLVALGLLAGGLVLPPPADTHLPRASVIDTRWPPRWSNLAWQGRLGVPRSPLVLTKAGHDLFDDQEPK